MGSEECPTGRNVSPFSVNMHTEFAVRLLCMTRVDYVGESHSLNAQKGKFFFRKVNYA